MKFKTEVLKDEWQKKHFHLITRYSTHFESNNLGNVLSTEDVTDAMDNGSPVFLLQPVPFNNHVFNFMFDSGCQNFVCRKGAIDKFPDNCK